MLPSNGVWREGSYQLVAPSGTWRYSSERLISSFSSLLPNQSVAGSPEFDGAFLHWLRRFSIGGDISQVIGRCRCRGCLRNTAAKNGDLPIGNADFAPEPACVLAVDAAEFCV